MKKILFTPKAPEAIGPYSQAVEINGFIYTSGQIPLDPVTGEIVVGGIAKQTERVFENIKAILENAGSGLPKVIKTTCFLKSMNDFAEMNNVYANYFTGEFPARSTIEVARLPKDVLIEIEVVALK